MPPVLHVPIGELPSRGPEQVFSQQRRIGMNKSHRILQLVPETEGST
jgi:hypothetical protein